MKILISRLDIPIVEARGFTGKASKKERLKNG